MPAGSLVGTVKTSSQATPNMLKLLSGSLISSFIADKYSRKVALQVSCILWIIGAM